MLDSDGLRHNDIFISELNAVETLTIKCVIQIIYK